MAERQVQGELLDNSDGFTPTGVKGSSPGNQSGSRPGSNSSSSGRSPQKDYYWFAQAADLPSPPSDQKSTSNGDSYDQDGRESVSGCSQKDREERIRLLRERQSEERQRKLEDLKLAALHAQKVREQQEEERRRKIEELKIRDQERRTMVEERKKQIWEAEKERREAILRRNTEREARIEARRNANRSSIGFAFGSCTPRLLDDSGYFSNRRSASQTNVMLISTNGNRHSVERDIECSKKRASSSSFRLDHKAGDAEFVPPSIYEIFHWPDINSHHFSHDSNSPSFTSISNTNSSQSLNLNNPQPGSVKENSPTTDLKSEYFPVHRADKYAGVLKGSGAIVGEDLMTKSLSAIMGPPTRGRRKTDLTPTLPLHDSPRTHSPGRALSMTRLDLLAQPRRPFLQARQKRIANTTTNPLSRNKTKSMLHLASPRMQHQDLENPSLYSSRSASKSMSHLAGTESRGALHLSKLENNPSKLQAQSMWHLTPTIVPRLTRAAQLRTTALLNAKRQGVSKSMMQLSKKRNDDESSESNVSAARTTPSSPSRPNSSMSQQSLSSHASQSSTVSMRNRNTSYRPRPVSIAGTPTDKPPTAEERQSRSIERKALSSQKTPPRAKSAGADQVIGDVNLSTVKPPSGVNKRSSMKLASAKSPSGPSPVASKDKPKEELEKPTGGEGDESPGVYPNIPPKPIPKMSPKQNITSSPSMELSEDSSHSIELEEILDVPIDSDSSITATSAKIDQAPENKRDSISSEIPSTTSNVVPTENDENVVPSSKPRITTEEEAKAALAERRRLAREQLEREAELERQRQEELKRQEEERIRREEEERKRWEEEQDRLRQIEAERLQKAIEEQQLKAEEEQKLKEEENRLKMEKEEAERKAREEQEKLRKETEERLRREEEERAERRKRVEAIMSRTRGKGTNNTPVTTPTKGTDGVIGKFEEVKASVQGGENFSDKSSLAEDNHNVNVAKEIMPETKEENSQNKEQTNLEKENVLQQPSPEDSDDKSNKLIESFNENRNIDLIPFHSNGFAENEETKETTTDFIIGNKSSEKKLSGSSLIDPFGEFDTLKAKSSSASPEASVEFDQLIDLSVSNNPNLNTGDFINNADNVNSNVPTNGPGMPFIAFEDNFTKKQETNVTDLL